MSRELFFRSLAVDILCLFPSEPCVVLQCLIVVFPCHTHVFFQQLKWLNNMILVQNSLSLAVSEIFSIEMDLYCLVLFLCVLFLFVFSRCVHCMLNTAQLSLFLSNGKLQKQLDEARKNLKYKEEIISNQQRDKEEMFTR